MHIYIRPFALAALTLIPGVPQLLAKRGTGHANSAPYCYGIWLKHLVMLLEKGMRAIPGTVAELGGESLGVGLAAMVCGVNNYYALDAVKHCEGASNVRIFDELVALFQRRAGRPETGWPDYDAHLDEKPFPSHILKDTILEASTGRSSLDAGEVIEPLVLHHAHLEDEQRLNLFSLGKLRDPNTSRRHAFESELELAWANSTFTFGMEIFVPFVSWPAAEGGRRVSIGDIELRPISMRS